MNLSLTLRIARAVLWAGSAGWNLGFPMPPTENAHPIPFPGVRSMGSARVSCCSGGSCAVRGGLGITSVCEGEEKENGSSAAAAAPPPAVHPTAAAPLEALEQSRLICVLLPEGCY